MNEHFNRRNDDGDAQRWNGLKISKVVRFFQDTVVGRDCSMKAAVVSAIQHICNPTLDLDLVRCDRSTEIVVQ